MLRRPLTLPESTLPLFLTAKRPTGDEISAGEGVHKLLTSEIRALLNTALGQSTGVGHRVSAEPPPLSGLLSSGCSSFLFASR